MTKPLHSIGYNPYAYVVKENYHLLEMRPRVLDHNTIQLAISYADEGLNPPAASTMQRRAGLLNCCPDLREAMAWTREQRMGARLETVQLDDPPEYLIADAQAHEAKHGCSKQVSHSLTYVPVQIRLQVICRYNVPDWTEERLMRTATTYSHRIVFKKMEHAFLFKMRWL